MRKRILASLMALCLLVGLLPTVAMAANVTAQEDTWDGTSDTSWYQDDGTSFILTTAEQLAGLATLVNAGNTFSGKTIFLGSNLNLAGQEWTAIGQSISNHFGGTFDGQNFQISNLTSKNSTGSRHGLFGVISAGGTVQNLYVVDADCYSNDNFLNRGILADWVNAGTVENCYTSGTVHNASGNKLLGGVIGQCTAGSKIIGCSSDAVVISDYYDDGDGYSDCDTVGGIVGQWENATDDAIISDCWFGGSISCGFQDAGVGGILGANFDFYDTDPGVDIKNCMVATKDIRAKEPGNITWIAAIVNSTVENCLWPDSPPDDVSLEGDEYEDYNGNYLAVVKLVVDLDAGTASADPDFDQTTCGQGVSSLAGESVLESLQANAGSNIQWVAGAKHPVFQRQAAMILLDEAISKISQKTEWTVRQEDANSAEKIKDMIEAELRNMDLDASFTVTVNPCTPAADGKNGSFTFVVELGKNGVSRFIEVTGGIILATPLTQAAPDLLPELKNRTTNSITLSAVDNVNDKGAKIEYGISSDGGTTWSWQSSPEFTGLTSGTTYTFALRYGAVSGDVTYGASPNGSVAHFSTNSTSSGGGTPTYKPDVPETDNGTVTVTPKNPRTGDQVTVTPKPDEGYEVDKITVTDKDGKPVEVTEKEDGTFTFTQPSGKVKIEVTYKPVGDEWENPFTDVAEQDYYYDAVQWAVDKKITTGTSATTFSPNASCTRGQMVTFLWRAAGSPAVTGENPFTDVKADAYYYDAVLWAVEKGITTGVTATTFAPEATVTRGQTVTFLYRNAGSPAAEGGSFADVPADAYYANAVAWAVAEKITTGTSDTTFSPEADCTRGQIVTFLYRDAT